MARAYQQFAKLGQQRPIFGREAEMEPNAAGGYAFKLSIWDRLERFLVLGSDGGTYYVGERKLTIENAEVVIECLKEDGAKTVNAARAVFNENRAPRVDPALFVMALALKHGDVETRRLAAHLVLPMLRTGSQFLSFVSYLKAVGSTNSRIKRRIMANWFNSRRPDQVAFQFIKYQQRNGWAQKDLLRLSHANPNDAEDATKHSNVYAYMVDKPHTTTHLPQLLIDYHDMQTSVKNGSVSAVQAALAGIEDRLPREALPTEALADIEVLRALLPTMPPHALLRNLVRLAQRTLLTERPAIDYVVGKLRDTAWLQKGHVHPFAVMLAAFIYSEGRDLPGSPLSRMRRSAELRTWPVQPEIVHALSDAFETLVNAQPRSDVRVLWALDCSGSMQAPCIGTPVRCDKAGAALILALGRPQPNSCATLFTTYCRKPQPITPRMKIDDLILGVGEGTDCSAPVQHALQEKTPYDAIVMFTDNETWYGSDHVTTWFQRYKQEKNKDCKLVVCSMTSSNANIVDTKDPNQLGIVGLDGNVAMLINSFIGAGQFALAEADEE